MPNFSAVPYPLADNFVTCHSLARLNLIPLFWLLNFVHVPKETAKLKISGLKTCTSKNQAGLQSINIFTKLIERKAFDRFRSLSERFPRLPKSATEMFPRQRIKKFRLLMEPIRLSLSQLSTEPVKNPPHFLFLCIPTDT